MTCVSTGAGLPEFAVIITATVAVTGVKAQGRGGPGGRRPRTVSQAPGNQGRIRGRGRLERVSASDSATGTRTDPRLNRDAIAETRPEASSRGKYFKKQGRLLQKRAESLWGGGGGAGASGGDQQGVAVV